MELSAIFMIFIGVNLLAFFTGNLVECVKLPKVLDFKPINCRLCLSTHTSWVLHTAIALLIGSWIYFFFGIISAVCIYRLISNEDKKQFDI